MQESYSTMSMGRASVTYPLSKTQSPAMNKPSHVQPLSFQGFNDEPLQIWQNLSIITEENLEKAGFLKDEYHYYRQGRIYVHLYKSRILIGIEQGDTEVAINNVNTMDDLMHLVRLVG